jgi:phytoene dehydrogenase-like protein
MNAMKKFDSIVVGGGISGMTMSLLLALGGRKVMLLEKAPFIGGAVCRFHRGKVPFDVGFHFTGGLQEGGILHDILKALGILEMIEPIFLPRDKAIYLVFEDEGKAFTIPYGFHEKMESVKGYFPEEAKAVEEYFRMVRHVCENTPSLDIRNISFFHPHLREDSITLDEVMRGLTSNPLLRGLLSADAMCYGAKPSEISFADHSRMCMNFYESLAYVRGGGDGFIDAFKRRFEELGVEVRSGSHIEELADINGGRVGRFVLSDGEEVAADNCVLTIHPREILKLLPEKYLRKAFVNRVRAFQTSVGFFSVYGTVSGETGDSDEPPIFSFLPHSDIDSMLDLQYGGRPALIAIRSVEEPLEGGIRPVHILESVFPEETAGWEGSRTGERPPGYYDYKSAKVSAVMEHFFKVMPGYRGRIKVLDSASMLTYRDYLNNHDGAAYGIRQKMGQFNLIGKLPLRNLHAAGQSAVLPGIVGAMMSSFIVGWSILGDESYGRFLGRHYAAG